MKKLWSIIALVVLLGGLLGAYVYLAKHPQDKNSADKKAEEKIELLKLDKTKINKINISNEKGNLSLEKKSGKWVVSQKNSLKLDETFVTGIENSFVQLEADKLVEKGANDLEKYGLKNPNSTAVVNLDDGTTKTVYLGNQTVEGNSYYLMLKDNSDVYIVSTSIGLNFTYGLNDIRDRNLVALNSQDIKYFKFINADKQVLEVKSDDKNNIIITKPYSTDLEPDADKFLQLISSALDMKVRLFIEDNVKDLTKYGLDKPSSEVLIKDSKNELHIYFGKELDDGDIAFKLAGNPEIYSIEKSKLEALNIKPFDLIDKASYIPMLNDMDSITIEQNSKKDVITIARTTQKAEKEGESDKTISSYKLNDKDIKEDDFNKFNQAMYAMLIESENDKKLEEKPEIKINFTLNTANKKNKNISFVSYNSDFYVIFVDSKAEFLVSKLKVQDMLKELENLKK